MKPPRPSKVLFARVSNSRTRRKSKRSHGPKIHLRRAIKSITFVSQTKRLTVAVCED